MTPLVSFAERRVIIMKAKSQEFMTRFADAYGSCICREILGYDISIPEEAAKIMEENKFGNV